MQHQQMSHNSKRGPNNSPKPPHQQHPRQSPNNGPSPGRSVSPPPSNASPMGSAQDSYRSSKHSQQQQPSQQSFSLTNFEDLLSTAPMHPPAAPKPNSSEKSSHKESSGSGSLNIVPSKPAAIGNVNPKNMAASALSESSSGEDSSSSSSSEDDDDDSSDMEEVLDKLPVPPAPDTNKSMSPILASRAPVRPLPPAINVAPSMPTDLLCEDLQLSESGSDSD